MLRPVTPEMIHFVATDTRIAKTAEAAKSPLSSGPSFLYESS